MQSREAEEKLICEPKIDNNAQALNLEIQSMNWSSATEQARQAMGEITALASMQADSGAKEPNIAELKTQIAAQNHR